MQLLFIRDDRSIRLATSSFLGLEVCDHPMEIATKFVVNSVRSGSPMTIVPLNPHVFLTALDEPTVAAILKRSLVPLDGFGILLISRFLGRPLRHRFTGTDLMEAMLARFAREGQSVYLLGGTDGVAEACAEVASRRFPGLRIAGVFEPPFVASAEELDEDAIVAAVNRSGADVLFVALGAPKQEIFLDRNRERLNVSIAMSVGASFDFLARRKRRAPRWMRERGMEWLFRVLQEPIRLGPRYAFGIPRFVWTTLIRGRTIQ